MMVLNKNITITPFIPEASAFDLLIANNLLPETKNLIGIYMKIN